jgi:ribonuclease P protein component
MGSAGETRAGGEPFGWLTRSREFQALRRGKRVQAGFGRLQGVARMETANAFSGLRVGLVVPKRLGNAPRRNRIKRLLRAAMRAALASTGTDPHAMPGVGVDIGIFPSDTMLALSFDALVAELRSGVEALMRKLGRPPI